MIDNKFGECMKKREIIEELNNKENLLVVGDSSLVLHGLKRECDFLETESLNVQEYDLIENIPCLSIKSCLERLKNSNNISNKAIIKKLGE